MDDRRAALLTALIAPVMRRLRSLFLLADALGLVAFTVIGCQVAQLMQLPVTVVIISGMITGCAGGCCAMCCATKCRCCSARNSMPACRW